MDLSLVSIADEVIVDVKAHWERSDFRRRCTPHPITRLVGSSTAEKSAQATELRHRLPHHTVNILEQNVGCGFACGELVKRKLVRYWHEQILNRHHTPVIGRLETRRLERE